MHTQHVHMLPINSDHCSPICCLPAAELSNNFGDTLSKLSPSLGAAFKAGADPIEAALEGLAASQQDDVARYFRSQRFRAVSGLLACRWGEAAVLARMATGRTSVRMHGVQT
jgi:hypothetical protein